MLIYFFVLIIIWHPQEVSLKISWRSDSIWLRYVGSKNVFLSVCLFVYWFVCFFLISITLGHQQDISLKILWRSNSIWLIYLGSKKLYLFVWLFFLFGWDIKDLKYVYLFVCLFFLTCFFYFNHLGTPTGIYPENFVKIGLDLAEIYRILKNVYLFVCLFVCLLNCLFFLF